MNRTGLITGSFCRAAKANKKPVLVHKGMVKSLLYQVVCCNNIEHVLLIFLDRSWMESITFTPTGCSTGWDKLFGMLMRYCNNCRCYCIAATLPLN